MKVDVTHQEPSKVSITVEVPYDTIVKHKPGALEHFRKEITLDGFRKGHAPDDAILQKVGMIALLEEMAHRAIVELYPTLLLENKIDAIGRPSIAITKIAEGNPLGFTITTDVMPTVVVGDYKKIAQDVSKKKETPEVSDQEVSDAILHIRKMRRHSELVKQADDQSSVPSIQDIPESELPELTVDDVKELGDFSSLEDFSSKLRENMLEEKKRHAHDKHRMDLLDALLDSAKFEVPQILIDHELQKMMASLEHDVSLAGKKVDDYLKHIGKTREEILASWHEGAVKQAKTQLVLNHIAAQENLSADSVKLEQELEKVRSQYKDIKGYDEDRAKAYLEGVLTNQAVFEFLEQ